MRTFLKSIVVAAGLSVVVVGCGGGQAPRGNRSDAPPDRAARAASPAEAPPAATDGGVCEVITAEDIASITGKRFAVGTPQVSSCDYQDDAIGGLTVLVIRQAAREVMNQMSTVSGQRAPSISGLGDEAYLLGTTILARKGEVVLQLSFGIADQIERVEEFGRRLVEIGLSRL